MIIWKKKNRIIARGDIVTKIRFAWFPHREYDYLAPSGQEYGDWFWLERYQYKTKYIASICMGHINLYDKRKVTRFIDIIIQELSE